MSAPSSSKTALRLIAWTDRIAFVLLAALIAGFILYEHPFWRPAVTVRSCGGNFDMLCAFARDFERRHECRVRYVAAPVQFLLDLALEQDAHLPQVLVGRSGPGWQVLEEQGKLAGPRRFFAVDPLVIVTPKGNPAHVTTLEDLGREGVRVAAAPFAMRPKGKVIAALFASVSDKFHPGLADRWERNTVVEAKCGRLLGREVAGGRADAAVTARSLTTLPPLAGRCETIEIPVDCLDAMTSGRGSLAQSAARTTKPGPALADAFVDELCGPGNAEFLARFGYIPTAAPESAAYASFLAPSSPSPMAGRQMNLAAALRDDGVFAEAVRRSLYVIHVFGPGEHDAEAWYHIGEILNDHGRTRAAAQAWRCLTRRYPTPGRKEWTGAGGDEAAWVARAREPLRGVTAGPIEEVPPEIAQVAIPPFPVREGDTPKGARRTLAVAADLFRLGLNEFAIRDALKIVSLDYPSPHMAAARALAGAALYRRGCFTEARRQWETVKKEHADSVWASRCAAACTALNDNRPPALLPVAMPPFEARYETHADRGMTYGWELYRARLPLYALKEYLKVIVGIYGEHEYEAEARYRAGVCLAALGRPGEARVQWRVAAKLAGDGAWGEAARAAVAHLPQLVTMTHAEQRSRLEIPERFPPPAPGKSKPAGGARPPAVIRLRLGEELLAAGVTEDDEALQEFLKVLTVVPSPPALSWTRTTAHVRAAQALLLSGRVPPARAHLAAALKDKTPPDLAGLAKRLLAECERRESKP